MKYLYPKTYLKNNKNLDSCLSPVIHFFPKGIGSLLILLLLISLPGQIIYAQPGKEEIEKLFQADKSQASASDFTEIDNYVINLKTKKNISEAELVALITQNAQTKMEKARAIFMWIATNIAYDTSYKVTDKEGALKQRKGVCQAYSGLFQDFGEKAGLEVVTISGDSKQYYYKKPSDLDRGGHAWNAVKADDGRWVFVDATWGAGHVDNGAFKRKLSVHWFDPSPQIYIFTHFPKEEQWQLLDKTVSREDFLRLPPLSPEFVSWGFNPDAFLAYYLKNKNASFPDFFNADVSWKIDMMPVTHQLKIGYQYEFIVELTGNEEIAVIENGKDWHRFEKDGNKLKLIFSPGKKGNAVLAVKQEDGKFGGVFKYSLVN